MGYPTPETGGIRRGEYSPANEIPRTVSVVQIPPVGKIGDAEVKFALHTTPMGDVFRFLRRFNQKGDLSIEGRICSPEQRTRLFQNPSFNLLKSARVEVRTINGIDQDTIMCDVVSPSGSMSREDAIDILSTSSSPDTLAGEIGYQNKYVSVEELDREHLDHGLSGITFHFIRGCNEFRLGSDTLPQSELDTIANKLGHYLWRQETRWARKHKSTAPYEGYLFLPLDSSYIFPPLT